MINPVDFFKSLSDETRLRCLMLIEQEGELCVCELTEALQEIQPKISRHLAQLRKSGLLVDRRQGQWIFYRINTDIPQWCKLVLNEVTSQNKTFLEENMQYLSKMGSRPERIKSCC